MNLYRRWVVPYLIELAMRQPRLCPYRRRMIAAARGRVLEIGAGSGLNLPLYGARVERVEALDPSAALLQRARPRAAAAGLPVAMVGASAEQLPFGDAVFDTVVTSWTLCSIPDPRAALREMRRVLAPDGHLLFVEHGLAPDRAAARWQHALTPGWKRISGGCHLDRNMGALIRAAGFELMHLQTGYMGRPKALTYV